MLKSLVIIALTILLYVAVLTAMMSAMMSPNRATIDYIYSIAPAITILGALGIVLIAMTTAFLTVYGLFKAWPWLLR
jgi:hypothetical protein